ncbi:hypothetical protein [Christiangramia echinicola]|uniref:Uncharacterized protein n=1 Tax=Christiangramia echinicola TaxID=279359 RepID=A0A1H1KVX8_9FLAO|nr:hypothetical protein [Christiangramia echinicola]SDR65829.1 hypothetical protein SAMN04488552_0200 [Christiangramia echinicola]
MEFVDQLKHEKESLLKRVSAINLLLESYGVKTEDSKDSNELFPVQQNERPVTNDSVFPINGRRDKQVLWLFENHLRSAVKLNKAQEEYRKIVEEYGGKAEKISNVARRLKKKGRLVVVKYNNMNTSSFWGLPSWVEENDFKSEFRPDESQLPIEVHTSEVIGNDK